MGNWRRGVDGGVGLAGVKGMAGPSSVLFLEPSVALTIMGDRLEAFGTCFVCFGRTNKSEKSSSTPGRGECSTEGGQRGLGVVDRLWILEPRDSREGSRPSNGNGERVVDELEGWIDLYDEEYRALRVLVGDRKGVKWAASFEPSDGGVILSGG